MINISKLPKWAQEYIRGLERKRETAIQALNGYLDDQTESPFYIDGLFCTGEEKGPSRKIRYLQTRRVSINYKGIKCDIVLQADDINICFWGTNANEVFIEPQLRNSINLVSRKRP